MPASKSVPAFLAKLYSMVNAGEGVHWADDGKAFIIPNPIAFSDQQLSLWFSNIQFSSFVRQLNMYDFHKIPSNLDGDISVTFRHELFQQGEPDMLTQIERKRRSSGITPPGTRGASDTRRRQAASRPVQTPNRRNSTNAPPGKPTPDLHAPGPSALVAAATIRTEPTQLVVGSEPNLDLDSILVSPTFPPSISDIRYDHTQAASALLAFPITASLQLSDPARFIADIHPGLENTSEQQQTGALLPVSALLTSTALDQDQEGDNVSNSETVDFFFPS